MESLRQHYDGCDQCHARIATATNTLQSAHYQEERTYPWEKYVTQLKGAFETLNENGEPKTESEKIRILLAGIKNNRSDITALHEIIGMNPTVYPTFDIAATHLSEHIAVIFPNARGKKFGAKISATGFRGKRKGNKNKGDQNKGKGKKVINGVDISDMSRYFTKKEWFALPVEVRKTIREYKSANKGKKDDGNSNDSRLVSSMTVTDFTDALTCGVAAASIAQTDCEVDDDVTMSDKASSTTKRGARAYDHQSQSSNESRSKKQRS